MTYDALTYPGVNDTPASAPLAPGGNFIYCPDVYVARTLAGGLSSGGAAVNVQGYGAVSLHRAEGPETAAGGDSFSCPAIAHVRLDEALFIEEEPDLDRVVRELAALVDLGRTDRDLSVALARLDRHAESLGRGRAPGSLLAALQARREALQAERAAAEQARDAAGAVEADMRLCRNRFAQLAARRKQLRKTLHAAVASCACALQARLSLVREQIEAFREAPLLDSRDAAAVKRKETLLETAKLQCERTREEIQDARNTLENLTEELPGGGAAPRVEVPDELRYDILAKLKSITEVNTRLDEVKNQVEDLDGQICQTQATLSALPDFTRIAPNPVDWLNQLSSSLKTAVSVRYEEEASREQLRRQIDDRRVAGAAEALLFADIDNFAQAMQEHEARKKAAESKAAQVREQLHLDRGLRDNLRESVPGLAVLGLGCALFLLFILGVYFSLRQNPLLYPAGMLAITVAYFALRLIRIRRQVVRLTQRVAEHHAELDLLAEEEKQGASYVEKIMARAGCATVRELEARYDKYYANVLHLRSLEEQLARQEQSLRESEERIPRLFERICATLAQVDEHPESPDDVERCVGSAIGKSRVYHDTVRRLADLRNRQQGLLGRRRFLDKEFAGLQEELAVMEKELRRIMRENGFYDESAFSDVDTLLTEYYRYLDAAKENLSRKELLTRRCRALEGRLREEEALALRHSEEFRALLEEFGLDNLDAVNGAAENAAALNGLQAESRDLKTQLEEVLRGHPAEYYDLEAGEEAFEDADSALVEERRQELARCDAEYEKALREYQSLREERYRPFANRRGLNEIEEDMAALEIEETGCRRRLAAAARAMALMEEMVTLWRNRHGAAIAGRAETLLREMGMPATIVLDLAPDASGDALLVEPGAGVEIAPGALNLVLRLAALELLGRQDMPEPLIIDGTLQGGKMPLEAHGMFRLLGGIAARRQVLVFSEDAGLATAAVEADWPALAV